MDNPYQNIQDIKQRRKKFLEDIGGFYNFANRAMNESGRCVYYPTKNSPGCAVGRWLPLEVVENSTLDGLPVVYSAVWNELPKWMKEMGEGFLLECQRLHDNKSYWNDKGLSIEGREQYSDIIADFCE